MKVIKARALAQSWLLLQQQWLLIAWWGALHIPCMKINSRDASAQEALNVGQTWTWFAYSGLLPLTEYSSVCRPRPNSHHSYESLLNAPTPPQPELSCHGYHAKTKTRRRPHLMSLSFWCKQLQPVLALLLRAAVYS